MPWGEVDGWGESLFVPVADIGEGEVGVMEARSGGRGVLAGGDGGVVGEEGVILGSHE